MNEDKKSAVGIFADGGFFDKVLLIKDCKAAFTNDGVVDDFFSVRIFFMHIDTDDRKIIIRFIIVDSFSCITAGGICRKLKLIAELNTAHLLFNRAEDVKELADIVRFVFSLEGVNLCKDCSHEPRRGREITGESERTHAAAEFLERNFF